MQLARIHQYLSMATPLLWTGQSDTLGVLGLAINTCAERDGHAEPRSTGSASCSRRRATSGSTGATIARAGTGPTRAG